MLAAIGPLLAIIAEIAPAISTVATVGKVIDGLSQLMPIFIKGGSDLISITKSIITALRANGVTTPEQLKQLDEFEARIDAEFEAAATAALAEDAAKSNPV